MCENIELRRWSEKSPTDGTDHIKNKTMRGENIFTKLLSFRKATVACQLQHLGQPLDRSQLCRQASSKQRQPSPSRLRRSLSFSSESLSFYLSHSGKGSLLNYVPRRGGEFLPCLYAWGWGKRSEFLQNCVA